jgi:hypothetical protein
MRESLKKSGGSRSATIVLMPRAAALGDPRIFDALLECLRHHTDHVYSGSLLHLPDENERITNIAVSGERIFDAFHTTKPGGLGMGLSMSRSIVESHGGRLWAVSYDGPGATFRFRLLKCSPCME